MCGWCNAKNSAGKEKEREREKKTQMDTEANANPPRKCTWEHTTDPMKVCKGWFCQHLAAFLMQFHLLLFPRTELDKEPQIILPLAIMRSTSSSWRREILPQRCWPCGPLGRRGAANALGSLAWNGAWAQSQGRTGFPEGGSGSSGESTVVAADFREVQR